MLEYWIYILLIVAIIVAAIAQGRVSTTFNKYNKIRSKNGMPSHMAARQILDYNGLSDVRIERVAGKLSDHYDPRQQVLRLSESTYDSASVAALGVAAHEVGHAMQDREGYAPMRIRNALVPVARIGGSYLCWILIILGFVFEMTALIELGIIFFSVAVLFQVATLPVEFNASSRALIALEGGGFLDAEEAVKTKKVLSAAAMTYVAAALISVLQLLRLLLIYGRRR